MPPLPLSIGHLSLTLPTRPLSPSSFSPYGDVIQNPRPPLLPPASQPTLASLPFDAVSANQGSAIKYQHVSRQRDLYREAPSRVPSQPAMNMFVCRARQLVPGHELKIREGGGSPAEQTHSAEREREEEREGEGELTDADVASLRARSDPRHPGYLPVTILERHPFTTQTFIPLSPTARYLVIVAPSLPTPSYPALPTPTRTRDVPGPGLPDLERMEAFVATGAQAVTYGAGTWHAPMVVLGGEDEAVDFVVVQFQNGVPREDCQEVALQSEEAGAGILVEVGEGRGRARRGRARL